MLQKIIPFQEVTSVRRAKTAGIFPNAIEIFAGGKKVILDMQYHFFSLWLCSDDAYKNGLKFFI